MESSTYWFTGKVITGHVDPIEKKPVVHYHARVENILDSKGNGETEFLRKYVGIPDAGAIFQTIQEIMDKTKIHIEITDLVIPEVGDMLGEARKLSK